MPTSVGGQDVTHAGLERGVVGWPLGCHSSDSCSSTNSHNSCLTEGSGLSVVVCIYQ